MLAPCYMYTVLFMRLTSLEGREVAGSLMIIYELFLQQGHYYLELVCVKMINIKMYWCNVGCYNVVTICWMLMSWDFMLRPCTAFVMILFLVQTNYRLTMLRFCHSGSMPYYYCQVTQQWNPFTKSRFTFFVF